MKRLEAQGLAQKKPGTKDRRVSEVTISTQGKALTMKIAEARMTLMNQIFKEWQEDDVGNLFRLVRKYADSIKGE
ncbi:hypothetical protein D3C71_1081030 [compost metagenome]